MKLVTVIVTVPVEDEVSPAEISALLSNQLALNPVTFVGSGRIDWMKVHVRSQEFNGTR